MSRAMIFMVVTTMCLASRIAMAQSTPLEVEQRWATALQKGDTTALDAILASTYVDTDEEGHRTDKSGVLSVLKSGDLKMTSLTLTNMQPHSYGDAVVVTGAAEQIGTFHGLPLTRKLVFTDTFVRQSGKWVAVASHRSAVR